MLTLSAWSQARRASASAAPSFSSIRNGQALQTGGNQRSQDGNLPVDILAQGGRHGCGGVEIDRPKRRPERDVQFRSG